MRCFQDKLNNVNKGSLTKTPDCLKGDNYVSQMWSNKMYLS